MVLDEYKNNNCTGKLLQYYILLCARVSSIRAINQKYQCKQYWLKVICFIYMLID